MTYAVLFVCSMNVCRSPLMHGTFVEALRDPERSTLEIRSRGVNVTRGNAICEQSGILLQSSAVGREFAQSHVSTPLSAADLSSPSLVIVATRAERALLARYAPALRSVTFTLREVNLLSAAPVSQSERAHSAEVEYAEHAHLSLDGFPQLLHRRRGTLQLQQSRTWGRQRVDPLDIPDAHLRTPSAHSSTLREVRDETRTFASRFQQFREDL